MAEFKKISINNVLVDTVQPMTRQLRQQIAIELCQVYTMYMSLIASRYTLSYT